MIEGPKASRQRNARSETLPLVDTLVVGVAGASERPLQE